MQGWVLLIDSDRDRLKSVSRMLLSTGMRVSCAVSSQAAASFLAQHLPDLVMVSGGLPGGREMAASLKADSRLRNLPLLFLASGTEAEVTEESFSGPSFGYEAPSAESGPSREPSSVPPLSRPLPSEPPAGTPPDGAFPPLEGISYTDAVTNCGGEEILRTIFRKFYESIGERADAIEGFAAAANWQDYRIAVHSLKSSARLIGALELSDEAKELEAAANERREEDIIAGTPALLDLYRSYRQKLSPLFVQADGESCSPAGGKV